MKTRAHLLLAATTFLSSTATACRDSGIQPLHGETLAFAESETDDAYVARMRVLATRYLECWSHFNAREWAAYKRCYTPRTLFERPGLEHGGIRDDVTLRGERALADHEQVTLELVVPTNHNVIATLVMTHLDDKWHRETIRAAHVITFDDNGAPAYDRLYFDTKAIPEPQEHLDPPKTKVVISTGKNGEPARADVVERLLARGGESIQHFRDLLSEDVSWRDGGHLLDKQRVLEYLAKMRDGMPNFGVELEGMTLAGDYVVVHGQLVGTPEHGIRAWGVPPSHEAARVPVLAIFEVKNGKVTSADWFWQHSALFEQLQPELFTEPLP